MFALKASSHLAANSSSTIRRSQDNVTVITLSIVSFAVSTARVPPTAMIQACGGLITAENSVMPNIPRLEIVNEPPWNSCSFSLPSRARLARSCVEGEQIICHGLRISESLGYIFQVLRSQFVVICSTLNHPCFFIVYCYLSGVFLSLQSIIFRFPSILR